MYTNNKLHLIQTIQTNCILTPNVLKNYPSPPIINQIQTQ